MHQTSPPHLHCHPRRCGVSIHVGPNFTANGSISTCPLRLKLNVKFCGREKRGNQFEWQENVTFAVDRTHRTLIKYLQAHMIAAHLTQDTSIPTRPPTLPLRELHLLEISDGIDGPDPSNSPDPIQYLNLLFYLLLPQL